MTDIRLIIVDPGHFHVALVQKEMHPKVSHRAHVYAALGPDQADYLTLIARFNGRSKQPTHWELEVHGSPDFLERFCRERAGNVASFCGRNRGKITAVRAAIDA